MINTFYKFKNNNKKKNNITNLFLYNLLNNNNKKILEQTTPYLYIPDDKAKLTRNMKRKYGIINESLQVINIFNN